MVIPEQMIATEALRRIRGGRILNLINKFGNSKYNKNNVILQFENFQYA